MKKLLVISLLLFAFTDTKAQQTKQYTQYLLNNYGLNPAVGGTFDCPDIKLGYRQQWVGFPGAPTSMFASFNMALGKKKGYRKGWHGIGVYVENDVTGPYGVKSLYPSYSYHLRFVRDYVLSFGVFAGFRQHVFKGSELDNSNGSDPAIGGNTSVLIVPDITPGLWLSNNKNFIGLSMHQAYKGKIKGFGNQVGTPSRLRKHFYFHAGKKIKSKSYHYTFVPSVHVKYTLLYPPAVDLNIMWYIKNKFGLGLSYRHPDAIVALIHMKFLKYFSLGYSYDYTLSKIRVASSNTHEVILGIRPCLGANGPPPEKCPAYN